MNNTTEPLLESEICLQYGSDKIRITRIVVHAIVALATYFGNVLILVSLKKFSEQLKGTLYILLGNLAVADLILAIGLTIQIITVIITPLKCNSYFCAVKTCIFGVSLTSSLILLMFISLDRFCAIVFPIKHLVISSKRRRRRVKLTIVWVISLVVICIPVITQSNLSPSHNACEMIPREISLAAAVFIPLQFIINIVLCLIVIWRLQTNAMSRNKYKNSMLKCGLLIKVYVAFALCWSPYVVTTILTETTNKSERYSTVRVYTIVPGLLNSAMNWIIYGLANKKLRDAFKNVLLCRTKRQLHVQNYIQSKSSELRAEKTENKTSSEEVHPLEICETSA